MGWLVGSVTADMDDDNTMPHQSARRDATVERPRATRRRAYMIGAAVVVLALVVAGTVSMFHSASRHLSAIRHDTNASTTRVATLTAQLAAATHERDRSVTEAAVARAALEQARAAHLRSADALTAQRSDLTQARRQAYASLVDANHRTAQLEALNSCLDGVSQALNRLAVGDVGGWQTTLESIDPTCTQAESVIA